MSIVLASNCYGKTRRRWLGWVILPIATKNTMLKVKVKVASKTNIFAFDIRLQKTSSRRLGQDQYIFLSHTSPGRLAKTPSRRIEDVFKTSSRHLQDILQRCLQDVFKTYHQVKLFLLTSLRDVFNTFPRRTWKSVICRRLFYRFI